MGTKIVTDFTPSINRKFRLSTEQDIDCIDQLNESLDKAEAMLAIFCHCDFAFFQEDVLRNFVMATRDMVSMAVDSLKSLNNNNNI